MAKNNIEEHKYDKAEKILSNLLKKDKTDEQVYFELGKLHLIQGKHNLAIKHLLKALKLNEKHIYTHVLLAKAYKTIRRYKDAIKEFQKSIKLGYNEENMAIELSKIYEEMGKNNASAKYLEKAAQYTYNTSFVKNDTDELINERIRLVQSNNYHGNYSENLKICKDIDKIIPNNDTMSKNILNNEIEIASNKVVLTSKLRSLVVSLTNKCNLKCIMCKIRDIEWSLPEKTKNEIVALFPFLEKVIWQGGEAFLYDGFEELLDEAGKHRLKQVIITNGLLINEKIAEKLAKLNLELTFSVDGTTKKIYEYIRPGSNFEKVIRNIKLINSIRAKSGSKMTTRLNVYVINSNYHQVPKFIEFAKKYGFNSVLLNSAGCDFENYEENMFYYNRDSDLFKSVDGLRDKLIKKADKYNIKLENRIPSKKMFDKLEGYIKIENENVLNDKQHNLKNKIGRLFCHVPWQRLYIDIGGGVRPECQCPIKYSVGNVKNNSIEEIWNGDKIAEYRKRIIENNIDDFCNIDCLYKRIPELNLKYI